MATKLEALPVVPKQTTVPVEIDPPENLEALRALIDRTRCNGRPLGEVIAARPGVEPLLHYAVLRALVGVEDDEL